MISHNFFEGRCLKMYEISPFFRESQRLCVMPKSFCYDQSRRSGKCLSDEGGGFVLGEYGGRETSGGMFTSPLLRKIQPLAEGPIATLPAQWAGIHTHVVEGRSCIQICTFRSSKSYNRTLPSGGRGNMDWCRWWDSLASASVEADNGSAPSSRRRRRSSALHLIFRVPASIHKYKGL